MRAFNRFTAFLILLTAWSPTLIGCGDDTTHTTDAGSMGDDRSAQDAGGEHRLPEGDAATNDPLEDDGSAGGSGNSGTSGTDGSSGPDGRDGVCEGDAGSACNCLTNIAPVVHSTGNPSSPPAALGGEIVSGTYHLNTVTYFGAACSIDDDGVSYQEMHIILATSSSSGSFQSVNRNRSAAHDPGDVHSSSTYTTNSTTIAGHSTCGVFGGVSAHYSATPTRYTVFVELGADCVLVRELVRQ